MSGLPGPTPTPLQGHGNLQNDSMVDYGHNRYAGWKAADLWNVVLKDIDPNGGGTGYGVTQAAADWSQMADQLTKLHDMLGQYLKPLAADGGWTGDAAVTFNDAATRVVDYT